MNDIFETVGRWRAQHMRVAVATVVRVEGSAPRDPGTSLAVNERGEVAGSVSGGCVEAAVYQEAQDVLSTGRPRLVTYGISDEAAVSVGLTCGGIIHVFIALLSEATFDRLAPALRTHEPVAVVTRLDGDVIGAQLFVTAVATHGELGSPGLTYAASAEARARISLGDRTIRTFGDDGEPNGAGVLVFIQTFAPKPDMYVFGAIDFSRAMAGMGKYLGYRVTVVDARPIFATKARVPDADEVVVAWPHEFLTTAPVNERTVIIVLTHDEKFDVPLLRVALTTPAAYIGAMGSRSTHQRRATALRSEGVSEGDLARVSAPVGLDIGARTPEETAVSIASEIVALRYGRAGGRLTEGTNAIHSAVPA